MTDPQDLIPVEACDWKDSDVPLHARGVRATWLLGYFQRLAVRVREEQKRIDDEWVRYAACERAARHLDHVPEPERPETVQHPELPTIRSFVRDTVLPLTRTCRAPLYALVPKSARAKPQWFISHAWDSIAFTDGMSFGTVDAIGSLGDQSIWIDFVSYNQHTFEAVASDMATVIDRIGAVAFAVTGQPLFTRSWCLWELLCADRSKGCNTRFLHGVGFQQDMYRVENAEYEAFTSVTEAQATNPTDTAMILQEVLKEQRSAREADLHVRGLLRNAFRARLHPEHFRDEDPKEV